jgi:Zn-dependent M16 (insulinase) family peptidase
LTSSRAHESFKLLRQEDVPLLQATFFECEHIATGAKHVHFACEDERNACGAAIPTVPTDETGAPHILEHVILSGSKHYPTPGSQGHLQLTGGGAWTGYEYTWYAFEGRVQEDFLKRIDSQMDLLFEPLMEEETFLRQAAHLEFESPEDPSTPLRWRGVIYNEQKGIFSLPIYVTWVELCRALFPELPYRFEHGGNAKSTPTITYEQLKDFHARHYHPSNVYLHTWGDIPLEDLQAAFDSALNRVPQRPFERVKYPSLRPLSEPKRHVGKLPVAAGEDPSGKGMVVMGWVTAPASDAYEFFMHDLVSEALMGPSGLLRQALVSSGLGKNLAETLGQIGWRFKDLVLSFAFQDIDPAKGEEVEQLVMKTLSQIVQEDVNEDLLNGIIHKLEFRRRTVQGLGGNEGSPASLFNEFVTIPWINGGDPLGPVDVEVHIKRLQKERESGRPLEDHIQRWLLDNRHRALVILEPDPGADRRLEDEEAKELEARKKKLTKEEIEEIIATSQRLREHQERRSASVPAPDMSAITKTPESPLPKGTKSSIAGVDVETFVLRTNGITYLDLVADLGDLSDELWDYLQLFSQAIVRAGADGLSSDEMAARIDTTTGGVSCQITVPVDGSGKQHRRLLRLGGRAIERNQGDLASVMCDLLRSGEFSEDLVRTALSQSLTRAEAFVQRATEYLRNLAGSHVRNSWVLRDRLQGFSQLRLLRKVSQDSKLDAVAKKLEGIRDFLGQRGLYEVFVAVSDEGAIEKLSESLDSALKSLSEGGKSGKRFDDEIRLDKSVLEARIAGMPSAYNCEVLAIPGHDHPDAAALMVAGSLMSRTDRLEVAGKGTAYGAGCDASTECGMLFHNSVRDPNLARTFTAFAESGRKLREEPIEEKYFDSARYQLGMAAGVPDTSHRRARQVFMDQRSGVDPARYSRYRKDVLAMTVDDVKRVADEYLTKEGAKATLASAGLVEAAKDEGLEFKVESV